MVDEGHLLNYDACVQHPRVWGIAAANKLAGDDPGLNNTRYGLCTNYYKNGSWRGGISPGIDDRKDVLASEWTPDRRRAFVRVRDDIVANFNNNLNVVRARSVPAVLDYPNAQNEVDTSKNAIDSLIGRVAAENGRIGGIVQALQRQQGQELMDRVSEKEQKIRKLETENNKYRFQAEIAREQADSVYNKYESNQHSGIFGYGMFDYSYSNWYSWMPYNPYVNLNPSSRSGLLFLAFFFGFLAIIAIGVKVAMAYMAFRASGGQLIGSGVMSSFSGLSFAGLGSAAATRFGTRMPDVLRY